MGNLCFLTKSARLREEERKFQQKLEEYHYILQNIDNQILVKNKKLKEIGLCSICFENEWNIVYVSCGHVICEKCDIKQNITKCPFCRDEISWKQRIFKT